MSSEQAAQALNDFSFAYEAYRGAVDFESQKLADKTLADAQLASATADRVQCDSAAEAALSALLAALKNVGIEPSLS